MVSFIKEMRRDQIIEVAIETIAKNGYINASIGEIASDAGISKGVISYHFKSKDELISNVLEKIISEEQAFVQAKVTKKTKPADKLIAYIKASFEYIMTHRAEYVAFVDLYGSITSWNEKEYFTNHIYAPCIKFLDRVLKEGIESGVFADVDIAVAATLIQATIDGITFQWVLNENAVNIRKAASGVVQFVKSYLFAR